MSRAYFNDDTIAAAATAAHVVSPVAIVRVSGPRAVEACSAICQDFRGSPVQMDAAESHRLIRCRFNDASGKIFDDGLFVVMRAPNSFTGEDCVELHHHGNPHLVRKMLDSLIRTGMVRPAERGEFSFRAFRNGKMDLSQAEAVIDLVSSKTPKGAELALRSMMGGTRGTLDELKARLVAFLADVEVEIDFSDQGLSQIDWKAWGRKLFTWTQDVEAIRDRFTRMAPMREGVRVALVGAPNAGKSTLFNQLLGEDRSIVSDMAGTTRDVVREHFEVDGVQFSLSDTAGLREAVELVEAQGIERSLGEVRSAHLVLLVVDATHADGPDEVLTSIEMLKRENPGARGVVVFNKIDLLDPGEVEQLRSDFLRLSWPAVWVSSLGDKHLETLRKAIFEAVAPASEDLEGPQIGRTRHHELLGKAASSVERAVEKVERGELFPDLLASDLRDALAHLGQITGEVTADDVLNYIFAEFCIGK